MMRRIVFLSGLVCSSSLLAMSGYFFDDNGDFPSVPFVDPYALDGDPLEQPYYTSESSNPTSSSSSSLSSSPTPYQAPSTTHQHQVAAPLQPRPFIELHVVHGEMVGHVQGIGCLPVVFSPDFHEATQNMLKAYHEGILAEAQRAYAPPFASPIPANSTHPTSSEDSLEKNSTDQDSNDSITNPSKARKKRSPQEMSNSQQAQAQNHDPLDLYVGDIFDALLKCSYQEKGAHKPKAHGNSWQITVTDIDALLSCTYGSARHSRKAAEKSNQVRTIKGYFSDWPSDYNSGFEFTVTIREMTLKNRELSSRVAPLLARFGEVMSNLAHNENNPERKSKRQKN